MNISKKRKEKKRNKAKKEQQPNKLTKRPKERKQWKNPRKLRRESNRLFNNLKLGKIVRKQMSKINTLKQVQLKLMAAC